jgi:hypothetical protein
VGALALGYCPHHGGALLSPRQAARMGNSSLEATHLPMPFHRAPSGSMDASAIALLMDVRRELSGEVEALVARREELGAQHDELGKKLKEVETELEGKRRMLRLMEVTEQQLRAKGGPRWATVRQAQTTPPRGTALRCV